MANFYNGNELLKSLGVPLQFDEAQISEYLLCKQDPIYFINNYCKITSLDHGLVPFILYDYQVRFINSIHENRRVISMQPRQQGKCVSENTKYKVRNKKTGETLYVTAKEFHEMQRVQ